MEQSHICREPSMRKGACGIPADEAVAWRFPCCQDVNRTMHFQKARIVPCNTKNARDWPRFFTIIPESTQLTLACERQAKGGAPAGCMPRQLRAQTGCFCCAEGGMRRAYPWAMLMDWPGIETADGSGLQRQVHILDLLDRE